MIVAEADGAQEAVLSVLADLLLLHLLLLVLVVQRGGLDVALGQSRAAVQARVVRIAAARGRVVEGGGGGNFLFTNHIDRRTDRSGGRDWQDR